ncbi:hypothetical protein B0H13DRAFT_1898387 [Mycena leptocephala]|nr:hypothetical protein B0H13DRAFT_1898387 [Mycena leptocephala]
MWKRKRKGELYFLNALKVLELDIVFHSAQDNVYRMRYSMWRPESVRNEEDNLQDIRSEVDPDTLHQAYIRALRQKFQDLKEIIIEVVSYKDIFRTKSKSPPRLRLYNPIQESFKQQLEQYTNAEGTYRMAFELSAHPDDGEITNQPNGSRIQRTPLGKTSSYGRLVGWTLGAVQAPIQHPPVVFDESGNVSPANILSHGEHIESSRASALPEAPKTSRRESRVHEERRQSPQGTLCSPSSLKIVAHSESEEMPPPKDFLADGEVQLGNPGLPFHQKHVFLPDVVDSPSPSEQDVLGTEEGSPKVLSNKSSLELGDCAPMSYSEDIVTDIRHEVAEETEAASMLFAVAEGPKRPMSGADRSEEQPSAKCRKLVHCSLRHDCTTAFHCQRKEWKQQTCCLQPGPTFMMDGPQCAKEDAIPPGHSFNFTFRPEETRETSPPGHEEWKDSPMSDDIERDLISANPMPEDHGSEGSAKPTASVGDNHNDRIEDAPAISSNPLSPQKFLKHRRICSVEHRPLPAPIM